MSQIIKKNYFLIIFLLIVSCYEKEEEDNIAKVNDVGVSVYEFQMRFNFNPYLKYIKNKSEEKKIVLSSLIAEKIMAWETEKNSIADTTIHFIIQQHLKEAMIEQFRRDSVESLIKISESELNHEYKKSLKEIDIMFIAFNTEKEAAELKGKIDTGKSFESVVRTYMNQKGWKDEPIPAKHIIWGNEEFDLEDQIYQLKENEVSQPIAAHGEYYLIKVIKTVPSSATSPTAFEYRKSALTNRIFREKVKTGYTNLYKNKILPQKGDIDWKIVRLLYNVFVDELDFNEQNNSQNKLHQNMPLNNELYLSAKEILYKNMEKEVVHFSDNSGLSLKDVLRNLKYGPYIFDYNNINGFKKSFYYNIQLMVEFETIFKIAKQKGYEKNQNVQNKYQMWKSYYYAKACKKSILKKLRNDSTTVSYQSPQINNLLKTPQQKPSTMIDEYLVDISKAYNIKINKEIYEKIKLSNINLIVHKSHFANRMVVPPLVISMTGMPAWHAKIESILKQYSCE